MASAMALRFVLDDDGVLLVSLYHTNGGYLESARIGYLREPLTPMGAAAAAHALVRAWLSPELGPDAGEVLVATFEGLTAPF